MDNEEAAAVLVDRSASSASGLVAIAHGWPAVIGLASVSSAELETDADAVPASLYHFFAEEVFSALGDEVQQGLTTLSVAPVLDRELASALLGDEADPVITSALDVGILVERASRLDLHPLARSFLEEKSAEIGLLPADSASTVCLAHYRARRDWDAAFEVIARSGWPGELEPLVTDALDELLESARLSTLDRWCDFAYDAGLDAPMFPVARAEVLPATRPPRGSDRARGVRSRVARRARLSRPGRCGPRRAPGVSRGASTGAPPASRVSGRRRRRASRRTLGSAHGTRGARAARSRRDVSSAEVHRPTGRPSRSCPRCNARTELPGETWRPRPGGSGFHGDAPRASPRPARRLVVPKYLCRCARLGGPI